MAGDQDDSLRVLRISPAQNRINIGDFRRLGNAIGGRLGESVGPYFEASAAIVRVAVEFAFNPLTCCADLDIEEDDIDEGEVVSCPECGSDFEVITINPVELKPVEEEYEEEEEEEEADDGDNA